MTLDSWLSMAQTQAIILIDDSGKEVNKLMILSIKLC